jgi:hypothetical protein
VVSQLKRIGQDPAVLRGTLRQIASLQQKPMADLDVRQKVVSHELARHNAALQSPSASRFPTRRSWLSSMNRSRRPDNPGLRDVVGAFSEAIDALIPNNAGRTDLGEMAQAAAAETVVEVVTQRTGSLFSSTPEDVRWGLAGLATLKQFGAFARQFYARLTDKVLRYYVSRTTADQVGNGLRFATLAAKAQFDRALSLHCHEASKIVEQFAGELLSKTN